MKNEDIYQNANIVIVDDLEQVLSSVKLSLQFEGMKVTTFSNPIEGLEYLKNNKADVLLLDFFMPEMNGDEFVEELRKYNQETIIILQTGYSDKIPPLEMIDKMNIQGYLDKNKGEDELLLMTKSAVKTSFLNKTIREKDKEISNLNYKNAIIGDLISHLVNESKDQLFQIAGMNEFIKNDTDNYQEQNRIIKNATDKIYELYNALNFGEQKSMNVGKLIITLKELLKAKVLVSNVSLNIECIDNSLIINSDANELIYLLLKIIDLCVKNESKEITIKIEKNDEKICFTIKNEKSSLSIPVEEFINNDRIKVVIENNNVKILI